MSLRHIWYRLSGQARRDERNRADALAGRATSGHLGAGERDRLFREAKRRSRQRR